MPEVVPVAIARLLSLLAWIGDHPGADVAEAAMRFRRSPRQIRRDIEALGSVGDSLPGASFEIDWDLYEAEDRLRVRSTMGVDLPPRLTEKEAVAILVGLAALAPSLGAELRARIPRTALAVRALAGTNTPVPLVMSEESRDAQVCVDLLARAIGGSQPIAFTYERDGAPLKRREVEPWDLRLEGGEWILRGWCRHAQDERNFAISRMSALELLPGKVTHSPSSVKTEGETAIVRTNARGRWVGEEFASVRMRESAEEIELEVPVWNRKWFDSVLLDLAPCVIDAPAEAKLRCANRARIALRAWEEARAEQQS